MKRSYEAPRLTLYGNVESITLGDRQWDQDAFIGSDGTDGTVGTKCSKNPNGKTHPNLGPSLCS